MGHRLLQLFSQSSFWLALFLKVSRFGACSKRLSILRKLIDIEQCLKRQVMTMLSMEFNQRELWRWAICKRFSFGDDDNPIVHLFSFAFFFSFWWLFHFFFKFQSFFFPN